MLYELREFLRTEDIKGSVSINTLLDLLEEKEEDVLAKEIEEVMDDVGLLGSQRVDTLLLALAENEDEEEDGNEEDEEDEKDEEDADDSEE